MFGTLKGFNDCTAERAARKLCYNEVNTSGKKSLFSDDSARTSILVIWVFFSLTSSRFTFGFCDLRFNHTNDESMKIKHGVHKKVIELISDIIIKAVSHCISHLWKLFFSLGVGRDSKTETGRVRFHGKRQHK